MEKITSFVQVSSNLLKYVLCDRLLNCYFVSATFVLFFINFLCKATEKIFFEKQVIKGFFFSFKGVFNFAGGYNRRFASEDLLLAN